MSDDPDCLGMCAMDGDVCSGCGRSLDRIDAARAGDDLPQAPEGEDEPGVRLRKPDVVGSETDARAAYLKWHKENVRVLTEAEIFRLFGWDKPGHDSRRILAAVPPRSAAG